MPRPDIGRPVKIWFVAAAICASLVGCRSAIRCCTFGYAARASTPVDVTQLAKSDSPADESPESSHAPAPDSQSDVNAEENRQTGTKQESRAEALIAAKPVSAGRILPSTDQSVASGTSNGHVAAFTRQDSDSKKENESSGRVNRFKVPDELPGAQAAPLRIPPFDSTQTPAERRSLAATLFPDVEPLPEMSADSGAVMDLASLQQLAVEQSPVIRQAAASVEEARGKAIQAGLKPNPVVGYEGDTLGTARTAGYNGVFFTQEFVTADKLSIAQNAAMMEVQATLAELRKSRITLATAVRKGYFRVLVAQEQVRFHRAILKLSEEVYQGQIDLVAGGEAAPYEPMQLRVFAVQARNSLLQSQNQLDASWRQLAAAMGVPHMKRSMVEGSVETVVAAPDYDQSVGALLQRHSDLQAAQSRIFSASGNLRLQQVKPIPNVLLYSAFQHDDTTPLSDYSTNVQLSVPVPLFDRNRGNITSAHGQLVRANQNLSDTQNNLMSELADVHARYCSSTAITSSYRHDLLPDQVRVYRGVYERFQVDGGSIDFSQVVVAQQTLAQVVNGYLQALNDQWDAVVDLAELLQIEDLATMDGLNGGARSEQ
ncbi:MAG: TolC family protein [Planctomyces sp.]